MRSGCRIYASILAAGREGFPEPDVHSLSVTPVIVGNHRTEGARPYNQLIPRSRLRGLRGFAWESPGEVRTRWATLAESAAFDGKKAGVRTLWRLVLVSTNRRFSAPRKSLSSRASCRAPLLSMKRS